jgi:hypothetical protein
LIKRKEKEIENLKIFGQNDNYLWNGIPLRPDIIIERTQGDLKEVIVIDTK